MDISMVRRLTASRWATLRRLNYTKSNYPMPKKTECSSWPTGGISTPPKSS
jgi:hypothetical protein